MISDTEYLQYDAVGLAELVRRGELSASELLEAAIRRADAINPRLNAIVIPMYDIARELAARAPAGPFGGVPFLIKDLKQDYAGVLSTSGSRAYRSKNYLPKVHSEIVRRFLAAGTVVFGRTNSPELGSKGITEPVAWGATRNPWDPERSPGGSSGGSAAAVAAGIVPMAGANDGGGSIRIPASATGLFGLKPGRGRTPNGPGVSEAIHGAAMQHVVTRSVRDSALMLDAIHGSELGAPPLAPPERPYAQEIERDPGKLRIAFSARSPLGTPVDPEVVDAVEKTATLLTELGHSVEQAEPELDHFQLARDFLTIWYAQLANQLQQARELFGPAADFELDSLAMEAVALGRNARDYADSYVRWTEYSYQLGLFLQGYDLYMTPTLAGPPPRIGAMSTPPLAASAFRVMMRFGLARAIAHRPQVVEEVAIKNLAVAPFTPIANVTGVPAMSVPLHSFQNGLPLGIHFSAAHGSEGVLLSLAAQLERALPWADRYPRL